MKMTAIKKRCARLCVCAPILGIILVPFQASETVPVPFSKPANIVISNVPVPTEKPVTDIQLSENTAEKEYNSSFKALSLNLGSLFTLNTKEEYANGFKPLSGSQSEVYKQAFELQTLGQMDEADKVIKQIKDERLLGHLEYQRYMHASYTSSYKELVNWMERYGDHPNAEDIYELALSKRQGSDTPLAQPTSGRILSQVKEPTIYYPKVYVSNMQRSDADKRAAKNELKKISALVKSGDTLNALKLLRDTPLRPVIDFVEFDQAQTEIAQRLLYQGKLETAFTLSSSSANRSGKFVPMSGWIAGLAAWQKGDFASAAMYFNKTGKSEYASGWLASGGSFWAARAYRKIGDEASARKALQNAAMHSRTFYGLLAVQSLGQRLSFDWAVPKYTKEHEAQILAHEAGKRAFSLVAAQQYDKAELELMRMDYRKNTDLQEAVLAYASYVGLPGVSLRLGNMVKGKNGRHYDSALYPVSPWMPEGGYSVDPALVHAVIRQESRFDLNAKSYSGARGLMQLMPKTAQYIAQKKNYSNALNLAKLEMPEVNMKLGQDYLEYLLNGQYVKGDVVSLLVAYNAGPGNLLKWRKRLNDQTDPLLFIEMMPVKETRDYVERVMSNYWIYRHRAGLSLPSLAALSKGNYPRYAHVMQSSYPYQLAANQ